MNKKIGTKPTKLNQTFLKSILDYDPETGLFTFIKRRGGLMIGMIAGSKNDRGYIKISINNKRYSAHRLAFLYMIGRFPKDQSDHIDNNKSNNRWANLRECSASQNAANQPIKSTSASPYKGVMTKSNGKYFARACKDGEYHIGKVTNCPHEAAADYNNLAKDLHGEFAFLNKLPENMNK